MIQYLVNKRDHNSFPTIPEVEDDTHLMVNIDMWYFIKYIVYYWLWLNTIEHILNIIEKI